MSEQDTFSDLEACVSEVLSFAQSLASVPPGQEVPADHVSELVSRQAMRLDDAWSAYVAARHENRVAAIEEIAA